MRQPLQIIGEEYRDDSNHYVKIATRDGSVSLKILYEGLLKPSNYPALYFTTNIYEPVRVNDRLNIVARLSAIGVELKEMGPVIHPGSVIARLMEHASLGAPGLAYSTISLGMLKHVKYVNRCTDPGQRKRPVRKPKV